MSSGSTIKLAPIFIGIILHFFNAIGPFDSHPLPTHLHNTEQIDFADLNMRIDFLLHTAGGYCLGKLADKIGFIKVMKIICLTYILTSTLLISFKASSIFESGMLLCLVHGIHSFLRVSSFILPIVYIFRQYDNQSCYTYSALAWIVVLMGIMASNFLGNLFTNISYISWCIGYATSGVIGLAIYYYVGANIGTEQTTKIKKIQKKSISPPALTLALFLAGICTVGIVHQCYSLQHYAINVVMLKTSNQQLIHSPFWVTLLFTLLPAAQITKNLKMLKILTTSLTGVIFSVSLFYIFSKFLFLNEIILFFHQILLGAFFSLFFSPALIFAYHILQGRNSYFYMTFIFALSFPIFSLATMSLETLHFLPSFLLGAFLIIVLMSACLWMDHHFRLSSNIHKKELSQHNYPGP